MGSTRDDQWRPCKSPDFKTIRKFPKRLRSAMFSDIWETQNKRAKNEHDAAEAAGESVVLEDDEDEPAATDGGVAPPRQKKKKASKAKAKAKKKTKAKKTDGGGTLNRYLKPKKGAWKGAGAGKFVAACSGAEPPDVVKALEKADAADVTHLFGTDYSVQVWSQCWREWQATSIVVWTPGNGTPLLAAAGKIRCLSFGLDDCHVELLNYLITCAFAERLSTNEFAEQLKKLANTGKGKPCSGKRGPDGKKGKAEESDGKKGKAEESDGKKGKEGSDGKKAKDKKEETGKKKKKDEEEAEEDEEDEEEDEEEVEEEEEEEEEEEDEEEEGEV